MVSQSGTGEQRKGAAVQQLRKQRKLRPLVILRPYNAELFVCSVIACPVIACPAHEHPVQ